MKPDSLKHPMITALSADDLDTVLVIEQRAYAIPWTRGNFSDSLHHGYLGLACRVDEQLMGYAFMMKIIDEMHLLNLTIDPLWQGRGWGKLLLDAVKNQARDLGCAQLLLEVRHGNTRALKLYRESGFEQIGVRQQYYPTLHGREDAVVMRSQL
ncbi:MAG: ribosomal protein S18-alanine N-acetyltransferase [Burkholderiales bacterium]|nr:ribosomal protein S18-alanine N-acetyltransferase [Ferrovum sp.]